MRTLLWCDRGLNDRSRKLREKSVFILRPSYVTLRILQFEKKIKIRENFRFTDDLCARFMSM